MRRLLVDTAYLIAVVNPSDRAHRSVRQYFDDPDAYFIVTKWVLLEFANHLAGANRHLFSELLAALESTENFEILPASDAQFAAGTELYSQRADEAWSLTDCISINVMRSAGLTQALTTDHHFEQAGFSALLK